MGMAVSSSPPLVFFTETAYTRNSLHYFFTFKPDLRFIIEHIFFHTFLLFRKAFRVFGCLTCILNRIYIRGQDIYRPRNRHICVLQWEEIKTKNSGAKHQLCRRGDNNIYCYVHMKNDYKTQEYVLLERVCFKGRR